MYGSGVGNKVMIQCPNCDQETSGDYCQWCKYPILSEVPLQKEFTMGKVVVKPTWALAWGLCWRCFLITLGIYAVIFGVMFALGMTLFPFLRGIWIF